MCGWGHGKASEPVNKSPIPSVRLEIGGPHTETRCVVKNEGEWRRRHPRVWSIRHSVRPCGTGPRVPGRARGGWAGSPSRKSPPARAASQASGSGFRPGTRRVHRTRPTEAGQEW
jgi:hypothetical protein